MNSLFLSRFNLLFIMLVSIPASAQMITGVWKGKINRQKAEVKIVLDGDSLRGTSYYFESPTHYRRYSIKGFFNPDTNEAVWWDDQLLEEKTGRINLSLPGRNPMLSSADFNCPGGSKMMLDGQTGRRDQQQPSGDVHLDKVPESSFTDEWDFVIDNYLVGANDPDIIDSISSISYTSVVVTKPPEAIPEEKAPVLNPVEKPRETKVNIPVIQKPETVAKPVVVQQPQTVEEKFITRKKTMTTEIPLAGDSIELRFYDNAEIDGDSISLFLNDNLIFTHIRLTGNAYTIKLSVADLKETNELTMVAENLGAIPPNTSYMVAIVDGNRYEARLESTEGSSAMVRFVKKIKIKTNN